MPSAHNLSGSLISLCRYQIEFADVIPDVIPQVRALCPFISVVPKGRPPAGWPGFAGPCFRPSGVAGLGAIAPFAACGAPTPPQRSQRWRRRLPRCGAQGSSHPLWPAVSGANGRVRTMSWTKTHKSSWTRQESVSRSG